MAGNPARRHNDLAKPDSGFVELDTKLLWEPTKTIANLKPDAVKFRFLICRYKNDD